jgi:uncharacterized protein with PIN domain
LFVSRLIERRGASSILHRNFGRLAELSSGTELFCGDMIERHTVRRSRPKFLCDAMLGSLARWLRFFGFDSVFLEPGPEDRLLSEHARVEGRWLLTKDRELASAGPRTVLVRADDLDDQLIEVFTRLGLQPDATLERARCSECNGNLEDVSKEEVAEVVPPHVLATAPRFRRCSGCRRVYWPGSHGDNILQRMEKVISRLD